MFQAASLSLPRGSSCGGADVSELSAVAAWAAYAEMPVSRGISRRRVSKMIARLLCKQRKRAKFLQGHHARWSAVSSPDWVEGWKHQIPPNGRKRIRARAEQAVMLRQLFTCARALLGEPAPLADRQGGRP